MKAMRARKIAAWVVLCAFSFSGSAPWAQAQSAMDLSSTAHSVPAGSVLGSGSAEIVVGGHNRLVTPTAALTNAEALAVQQVMATGKQTLQVGALGNATGGSFVVFNQGAPLSSLVIPQGVNGILNFSRNDLLKVSGNVLDLGSLYAVSTNQAVRTASLSALGINVGQNALLTTVLSPNTLSAFPSAIPDLSLNLSAVNDIVNSGTIGSAGHLNLTAGSGTLINSGVITSATGNVNFAAPASKDISINNLNGRIEAAGNINVRQTSYTGNASTKLSGGDWLSQRLNINGGSGAVDVNVGEVSGQLTTVADTAHITAATPTLKLGGQCITGDPTFYNKAGNIEITGNVTANQDIAIIASGNIATLPGDLNAKISSNGHNISLIAGAHIDDSTCVGCSSSTTAPPGTAIPGGQQIAISAPTGGDTGGNISLIHSTQPTLIDSSATTGSGGNVSMVAFQGVTAGSGNISLNNGGVNTVGPSGGGSVTAIAGAASGQSFLSGSITTNGGDVSISSATPVVPGGTITANSTGQLSNTITAGTTQPAGVYVNGNVNTSSTYGSGGSFSMTSGSPLSLTLGSSGTTGVSGQVVTSGVDTTRYGDVTVNSSGGSGTAVSINTPIVARNVSITGAGVAFSGGNQIQTYGTTGSNGIVTLAGNGNDAGMRIAGSIVPTQFNVSNTVLSSIKAGTLVLKDATKFDLISNIDLTLPSSNYSVAMIGTSSSTQFFGNSKTITNGTKNVTIVAGGGIATTAGTGLTIDGEASNANAGSITLVSGKDIGNSTGNFQFFATASGSTGNGGNTTFVAGADNVTTSADGSVIQINNNTGSATGGSIIIPAQGAGWSMFTTGATHGGDITLVALPGTTPDSGQVSVASTANQFAIEAGSFNGPAGNVTVIAGAASSVTAGGGSGYTIFTGPIGTNYGAGNLVMSTAIPKTPVTISSNTNTLSGATVTAGSFLGGTPVDGAIFAYAISNFATAPSANGSSNSITLLAGSNAASPTSNAIFVNNIQGSTNATRSIDISLISGVAGGANVGTNSYGIRTGYIQGGANTSVYVSSLDSIVIGSDGFARSIIAGTKPVTLLAGTSSTPGDISVAGGILAYGSNIGIASLGSSGNISIGGSGSNGSINAASGTTGGSVAITTVKGTITATGHIASYGTTANGDVLLSSGSTAANSITIDNADSFGIVTGLSSSSAPLPGQIYVITNTSTSQSNVNTSDTTQSANGRAALPVLVNLPGSSAIGSGTTSIIFTPSNIAASQAGGVVGYRSAGFTGISDSAGASDIQISIAGNITDNKLFLPIVSSGNFSLGNNSGSKIEVPLGSKGVPELLFAGSSGVALGTLTNPVSLTTNGSGALSFGVVTNNGAISVFNSGGAINVKAVIGTSTASISNTNGVVSMQAPLVVPATFVLTGNTTVALGASIFAPQSISITSSSGGGITYSAGTLATSSLSLTSSNGIGASGTSVLTSAPQIIISDPAGTSDFLAVASSANISFNAASRTSVRVDELAYNAILTVNAINANTLVLQTSSGAGASINLTGNLIGTTSATVSAAADITASAGVEVRSPIINLTATTGSIGSSSAPFITRNFGSGITLRAVAGGSYYGSDPDAENIFLDNSSGALSAGTKFQLSSVGSIATTINSLAITSPKVSLTAGGNVIGAFGNAFEIQSGLGTGVSLFLSSGNNASIQDLSNDNLTSLNGLATPSAPNLSIQVVGDIIAQSPTRAAAASPTMHLSSLSGNIGSSGNPLVLSSGSALTPLTLTAASYSSAFSHGNVYVSDLDTDIGSTAVVQLDGSAGSGTAVDATTGNFQVTTPNGSIAVAAPISASSSIVLQANKSITGSTLNSPVITLTATTGNIGTSGTPLPLFGFNGVGAHVTATASANSSGFGNVYISGNDSSGLYLQNVSAGSGSPVDGTTGNVVATNSNGSVFVSGNVTGTTSVSLQGLNIAANGGTLSAPTINLTASTGGIGSFAAPLVYNANTLNISATNNTNGNVYLSNPSGALNLGTVNIGNLLYLTLPGTLNISVLNPFSSIRNLGLISTGGDILISSDFTATNSILLSAGGNIALSGFFIISAPTVTLNSSAGNIGSFASPIVVSTIAPALHLSANANANTSGNGNVYVRYLDGVLLLDSASAGSGTPVDSTTGNFSAIASVGSIGINGNLSAQNSMKLFAYSDIYNNGPFTVASRTIGLTAVGGNVGSSSSPVVLTTTGTSVALTAYTSANASGLGNVYVTDADSDIAGSPTLQLGNVFAGNGTPVDSTTGNFLATTPNGSIALTGNVTTVTSTSLSAGVGISDVGGATIISPNTTLNATTRNIGSSAAPILLSGLGVHVTATANANTTLNGNVYLSSASSDPVGSSALLIGASSAGSGTPVDSTTGRFSVVTTNGSIAIEGNVSGSNSVSLQSAGSITRTGSFTLAANTMNLTATAGNIGSNAFPLLVGTTGSNLHLTAAANANTSGNGNIYLNDADNDPVGSSALFIGASSAGSGTPVDSTTGNFSVTATNGSIALEGNASASNSLTLQTAGSITRSGSFTASSQTMTLAATNGNIGSSAFPLLVGTTGSNLHLTATANANTSGNGNIYVNDADNDPVGSSALFINASSAGSGTPVDNTTGNFSATASNGSIAIAGNVSSSNNMVLQANGSISRTGSFTVTSQNIKLGATTGNIGTSVAPINVSTAGLYVLLTATANANTSGNGNVYVSDADLDQFGTAALALNASSAGSGTPIDSTTGNFSAVASNGSIDLQGDVAASSSLSLQANSITNSGTHTLTAPQLSLTASQGGIGSAAQRLIYTATSVGISAPDTTNGAVYLESTDAAFTFGTVSVGKLLDLQVDQTVGVSKLIPAAATPNLVLTTKPGSGADIGLDAVLSVTSLKLVADGSIPFVAPPPLQPNPILIADTLDLTATHGNIGNGAFALRVGARSSAGLDLYLSATSNTPNNGNVYVFMNDFNVTHILRLHAATAGSGSPVDNSTGLLSVGTFVQGLVILDTISATNRVSINGVKGISTQTGSGTPLVQSPFTTFTSNTGNISNIPFGNNGNGVTVSAYSSNGAVSLTDNSTENVTIFNTAGFGPAVGGTSFTLTAKGDIKVFDDTQTAISAPIINLSAVGGNITADGTVSGGAILVNSHANGTGLLLNAVATKVSGAGGVINISDTAAEAVTLQNLTGFSGGTPAAAAVNFRLTTNGNIKAEDATTTAISSPLSYLTSVGGNISGDGTANASPLLLQSGNAGGVTLQVIDTPVLGAGGNVNVRVNGEALSLNFSNASVLQAATDNNMVANTVTAGTIVLTTPSLSASGPVSSTAGGGGLVVNGLAGALALSGAGSLNAANQIVLTAPGSGSINFSNGPTLNGNTVMNTLGGAINVLAGAPIHVNGNLTGNVLNTFNVGNFVVSGTTTINFPASNASVGTLINTTGDIVLGSKTIVNSGGKNIAILAAGNVTANGATTINLAGAAKSSGGNLTIIAGYDFTPHTSGQILDTATSYLLNGVSSTGGNINLPKLTVNTSSTAKTSVGGSAGNIFMTAGAGSKAAGSIVVGGLTATSTNGAGGNVTLFGPGGVIVNGSIATTGKTSGGAVNLVGAPGTVVGNVQVQDGYLTGGLIVPGAPIANAGAAVIVTGTIKTNATVGNGGAVTAFADQQVTSGAITTTGASNAPGGTSGGAVLIQSLGAYVKADAIATNALNVKLSTTAGSGGSIQIFGQSAISTGNLIANGGSNTGTGNGGAGGAVTIGTASVMNSVTPAGPIAIGVVNVKGYINTAGGAVLKTAPATGGAGGAVTLDAAALAITGSTGGNSILASGGIAGPTGTNGAGAQVTLHTYAIQPLPTALDLTSTTRSIVALPGGMFSVGSAGSPNGVAGNIKSDQTMSKTIAANGFIFAGTTHTPDLKVNVTVTGSNGSIKENETTFPVNIVTVTGTKRTLISPAEALALFQTSRGDLTSQTLTVTSTAPTKGGTATGVTAPVQLSQFEVGGQSFTAFKLPASVSLDFTGVRAVLNLPSSAVLNGTLNFSTANAVNYLNAGSGALTIGSSGSILADSLTGTLILSGTGGTWTNNGNIGAATLVLARPGTGALTYKSTGLSANTTAPNILIDPTANGSSTMTFTANGVGSMANNFNLGVMATPTMYTANAQAIASGASKLPAVALTFSLSKANGVSTLPITADVGGTLNGATLTVKGIANTFNKSTVQTPIKLSDLANFAATTTINVSSTGLLTVGAATLNAGKLAPLTSVTTTIAAPAILSKGSITLSSSGAAGVLFNSGAVITNNGALLQVLANATGGLVTLGTGNTFNGYGGNVSVLAKGNVLGGTTNGFNAVGITNTASGGIEIGAGTTVSNLAKALGSKPTNPPTAVPGATIAPNGGGKQVLLLPGGTTGITLGNGANSTLDFTGRGAMVFNVVGGKTIQLTNSTFITVSSKPVGLKQSATAPVEEFVVDTDYDDSDVELVKVSR